MAPKPVNDEEIMEETDDEDTIEQEFDSGPFCRHYADRADCDIECLRCGHPCHHHGQDAGDSNCRYDADGIGCDCEEFEEDEETEVKNG